MYSPEKIDAIKQELERFQKRLKEFEIAIRGPRYWMVPKESGAVRRASLDLTRELANFRRPD